MAKKKVTLNVNEEEVTLKLGFNGLIYLEEELGRPMTELSEGDGIKFADLRTIFYVALKKGSLKDITVEETGDLIDDILEEQGMEYLSGKLTELFNTSMGNNKKPSTSPKK